MRMHVRARVRACGWNHEMREIRRSGCSRTGGLWSKTRSAVLEPGGEWVLVPGETCYKGHCVKGTKKMIDVNG